ncbi:MAG: isoprenylcysteine carboxylmethyltransferase family protein [Vicinamibacterales bacterium]
MPPRLRPVLMLVVGALVTFGLSGRWLDPWLWAWLLVWSACFAYAVTSISDGLARERFAPPEQSADRLALHFIRLVSLGHIVIGALDTGRWHLFPVATPLRAVGLAGMAFFGAMVFRAMVANQFFSAVVRVQRERGHQVVDVGPYATVRHPGYLGMMVSVPCSGLVLGSWLAVGLGLVYAAMMLRRVMFEDAFLRVNLDGYADYRTRVRYRLVPGLW